MKTSWEKHQQLSKVSEQEKQRLVDLYINNKMNSREECKKYGVTKDTFQGYVNNWVIAFYQKQTNSKNRLSEIEIKDLSFSERLKYELSKIS